jgi:hypothetical protein
MLLSCRFLNDVGSVNSFEYVSQVEIYAGDTQTLYFQLIDASLDRPEQGFQPSGRRYMPAAGASLVVTLMNVDDAKKVVRTATQPYPQDPSIWSIPILATDPLLGSINLKMVLTEGPKSLGFTSQPGALLRVR